jgi:hypothetical protein
MGGLTMLQCVVKREPEGIGTWKLQQRGQIATNDSGEARTWTDGGAFFLMNKKIKIN